MRRFLLVACLAGIAGFSAAIPAQQPLQHPDARLITDADYKTFLIQIEAGLPKWEMALKNIDPQTDSRISYALGKSIAENRDVGLLEINYIRLRVAELRVKRTVSDELALRGFLESLYSSIEEEVAIETIGNLNLSDLEKFEPELSTLDMRIGNDVLARVELLEKGSCP